ncbi:MAG: Uma2 family endonuclease [Anaerolineae bacterium]
MVFQEKLITADEFLHMEFDDGKRYELVDGMLEEMPMSGEEASELGLIIGTYIASYVREHGLGRVTGADGGYLLDTNPDKVRYPDVGFISLQRLPNRVRGFVVGAPDLAVEVMSPTDRHSKIQRKAKEYLRYGTKMVWVVDPDEQIVEVHTLFDAETVNIRTLDLNGTLDGGTVLPGFSLAVKDIFK